MKKRLKVGHIGTIHDHSSGILQSLAKFPQDFEIIGVARQEEDPRHNEEWYKKMYGPYPALTQEQLLNAGCDFMVCEGFEYDLPFAALRCVENGIPVHLDKPAGRDLAVFEQVLRTAKAKDLPVQLGYMYRYNPAVMDCFSLVKSGALGEIHSVTALMSTDHPIPKRQWLERFGDGGIMFFLGCHMIDLVYQLQGIPEKLTPTLTRSGLFGCTSVDMATATLQYPKGVSIIQSNSTEIGGGNRRQLVVNGSLGSFEIRPLEYNGVARVTFAKFTDGKPTLSVEERRYKYMTYHERYDDMMLDFAAMVRKEKENPYTYEAEAECQRMVLAACGYNVDYHKRGID